MESKINCFNCEHFYVTWDISNPKGCRYFGFKTKLMPSIAVKQSSGQECGAYKEKANKRQGEE